MLRWLWTLGLLSIMSGTAWAQAAVGVSNALPQSTTIQVQNAAAPNADTYGIDSTRFPHVSYAGSSPATLDALLKSIPSDLGPGVARDMLIALMIMPVYPDSASAIPKDWFTRRVDKLIQMAAYEDAFRLLTSLPDEMRNNTQARRYVDLALSIGDTQAACEETANQLANSDTSVDAYWSLRRIFCHRIAEEHDQAEFVLGFFSEQYPNHYPLTIDILNNWGSKNGALPPFSAKDGDATPLLIAALKKHDAASQASARLDANFIAPSMAQTLAPGLAVILSEMEVFDLPLRIALLEHAVMRGAGQPEALRVLYNQATKSPALRGDSRRRAALITDIQLIQNPANQVSTVSNALTQLKHEFSPYIARGLVGTELTALTESLPDGTLPAHLLLDMAAYHMERNDTRSLDKIRVFLRNHRDTSTSHAITLAAIDEAMALDRLLHGEGGANPVMPAFETAQDAHAFWILSRQVAVEESLGHMIPADSKTMALNAPLAQTLSPEHGALVALQGAEDKQLQGELILRAITLLNQGRLAYVSDTVIARLIAAMQKIALNSYSVTLAKAAILNPPVEPLRSGGRP